MKANRLNNPRVNEIEEQIGKLTTELFKLVDPGEDDYSDTYEEIRDIGPDGISDLDACLGALDSRDCVLEEALDHLRHGREVEAREMVDDSDLDATLEEVKVLLQTQEKSK